ncbi:MAG: ABC transporter substrate-binding protein, partial [Rhizobiales bacterium]|nr:ABC transporter substrate-binding protein [Hyphomicrobiales bacterium]
MKRAFCVAALAAAAMAAPASSQQLTDGTVKLGVLTDMSSLYSDINGIGAVIAVQMAIDDFGGSVGGKKIEIVQADVQNK